MDVNNLQNQGSLSFFGIAQSTMFLVIHIIKNTEYDFLTLKKDAFKKISLNTLPLSYLK